MIGSTWIFLGLAITSVRCAEDHGALIQTDREAQGWVQLDGETGTSFALKMVRTIPGMSGAHFPEGMPPIDIGELMSLAPLIPGVLRDIHREFPKAIQKAQRLKEITTTSAQTLRNAARADSSIEGVHAAIRNYVVDFKNAWVEFAVAMDDGINATFVPFIETARPRVHFIGKHASSHLVHALRRLLNRTGLSVMAQLPVGSPGKSSLIRLNQLVETHWNRTKFNVALIKRATEEGGLLDQLSSFPQGQNTASLTEMMKGPSESCLDAVLAANDNTRTALHAATEAAGVDWRASPPPSDAGEDSGEDSACAPRGFRLLSLAVAAGAIGLSS